MSRYKSLMTVCCAAVLTLGLAACGGGSDSDQAAAPPTVTPEPDPPTPMEQLAAARDAVAAAQALVGAAMTPAEIAAAYGALAAAQAQLSAAETIPANQIAILAAELEQLRMDLRDTEMLAAQRGTVGAALIAAQTAVSGLSATSTDEEAAAASALVTAAQTALANASALPPDDALRTSIMAVATQLAGVEMDRTVHSQQGMVDAQLAAAQELVNGLSVTSTDEEVTAARTAVMAAQAELALATDLPADDPRPASVMGVYEDLGDAVTMRTAHMDTQTINGLIATAQMAVDGLDQITSSGADVETARAAVMAVTDAIAASTALTEAEKAALGGMVSMAVTDLQAVDTYRATASGQLAVAEAALAHAQGLVDALTPTSTAAQAAEAYGALGEAQAAIHAARALPANVIARLTDSLDTANKDLGDANRLAGERETVGDAIVAATTAIAGLNADSTVAEIEAAKELVTAAQTALSETMEMSEDEKAGLGQTIASLGTQIGNVETLQMAAEAERMQTEQRNAALTALSMAQAAINGLNDDSPAADVEAARGLVTAAQTALNAATGLSPAESDGLQMLVTAADTSVTGYETIVAARPTQEEIDAEVARVEATTDEAVTKETAIKAEMTDDAGLGGADAANYTLTIKRPRSGTEIGIADSTAAGEDDPKFAEVMDLGGGRTMHRRDMEADDDDNVVQEIVIVATDIDAPKATKFATEYTLTHDEDGDPVDADQVAIDLGNALTSNDDAVVDADEVVLARIMAVRFPAAVGDSVTHTFNAAVEDVENTDADESRDAAEVAGTYQGGEGTYKCTGNTDCTVTVNNKGELTAATDGWIFIPASGATVDVADADYLHYGFWLKKTTDEDGVLTYNEVQTFAGSSVDASGGVADVDGSATYKGGATGVYVHSVTKTDGTRESATAGQFKADATLEATFGQLNDAAGDGTIAPNLLNTLSGTINNFVLEHGEEHRWSVSLEKTDIDTGDGTLDGSGVTKGGGAEGSYSATFHGSVAEYDHDGDDDTAEIARQPGSVVGEFDANFSNGSVAGAFGARK